MFSHVFDYKASVVLSAARRVIEKNGQESIESSRQLEEEVVGTKRMLEALGTMPVTRALSGDIPGTPPRGHGTRAQKLQRSRKGSFVAEPASAVRGEPTLAQPEQPAWFSANRPQWKADADEKRAEASAQAPKSVTKEAAKASSAAASAAVAQARTSFDEALKKRLAESSAEATAPSPPAPPASTGKPGRKRGMHVDSSFVKKNQEKAASGTGRAAGTAKKAASSKPGRNELLESLLAMTYTEAAGHYGVSATTIRRWASGYGLPTKRTELIEKYGGEGEPRKQ